MAWNPKSCLEFVDTHIHLKEKQTHDCLKKFHVKVTDMNGRNAELQPDTKYFLGFPTDKQSELASVPESTLRSEFF